MVKLGTDKVTGEEFAIKIMVLPEEGATIGDNENTRDDVFKEIGALRSTSRTLSILLSLRTLNFVVLTNTQFGCPYKHLTLLCLQTLNSVVLANTQLCCPYKRSTLLSLQTASGILLPRLLPPQGRNHSAPFHSCFASYWFLCKLCACL